MKVGYKNLWKLLIDKNINKTELIKKTGITSNAMAKMGRNETVQLDVLIKICKILDCKIDDIIEY